ERRAGVQTSAPQRYSFVEFGPADQRRLTQFLAIVFANSLTTWAGMLGWRHELAPEQALDVIGDGLLVLNEGICQERGIPYEADCQLVIPELLSQIMGSPEVKAQFLEKIVDTAKEGFSDDETDQNV